MRRNPKLERVVENTVVDLLKIAATVLPRDVQDALREAYEKEESEIGKFQLKNILENIELAEKLRRPICQDTGLPIFYLTIGNEFGPPMRIEDILVRAVRRATREVPLRPSVVHPITRRNTGDNTGHFIPRIHWRSLPGDFLEITILLKGAGCENVSSLRMLRPGDGLEGIEKFVLDIATKKGAQACPPLVVGVGIGGSAEQALELAERSLLRPIGVTHPEKAIVKLEKRLLKVINATGVGPMGLGGNITALDAKVEYAYTHTASLPVGVSISCWCLRKAFARIHSNGIVVMLEEI